MGQEAAASTIVERSLLSIRRRGAYLGPVIVLTDASPVARYRSLTSVDPNLIVLQPRQEDWRWDLVEDMPYKRFKTYILEYLDLDERLQYVERVYYLDIDVVVGRELQEWFDHVEGTYLPENRRLFPSCLTFFKGNYEWRPLQGGQFIIERKSSQPCLERWRYHIDAHPEDPKDQSALTLMLNDQKNTTTSSTTTNSNICHLTIMPQHPYLQFLNHTVMQQLVKSQQYPTLMHIKNTEHADWIPQKLQRRFFEQLLMLSPAEARVIGKTQIHPPETRSSTSGSTRLL
jgi:hypothetical protein